MGKKTTTLTLDSETVEKAKKMNLNISELTETVLKGFTFEPTNLEDAALKQKYGELFRVIQPILEKQKINICIAYLSDEITQEDSNGREYTEYMVVSNVFLLANGKFYLDGVDGPEIESKDLFDDDNIDLLSPKKILSNLIEKIEERKEKIKDKMTEVELVKRIVEALHPTFAKK